MSVNNKPLPRTALEPVCVALAEVIQQRRKNSGLSLNRLAELTRLSRQMISFIETTNQKVIKGVVGDPNYGDDSNLYEAMGYVRKSERASGLTKKSNVAPAAAKKTP
jgi:transcriptional regulator with XRE-family HTH domain